MQWFTDLHLFLYSIRLTFSVGILMHCKPAWWQALIAFNKLNVKATSSMSKVAPNDSLVCCHLLAEDDGSAVLHIKLKTTLRLFGAKDPSSWQSNPAFPLP